MNIDELHRFQTIDGFRMLIMDGCLAGLELGKGQLVATFTFPEGGNDAVLERLFGKVNVDVLRSAATPVTA